MSSKSYIVTAIVKIHVNDTDSYGAIYQATDLISHDIEQGRDGIIEWVGAEKTEEVSI
jgi:hypothetical protein